MLIRFTASFLALFALTTYEVSAWGPRGHFAICEVAIDFVKNKELREFLKPRRMMLGHLCNAPDSHWKALDYQFTSVGNPGHYLNPENIGKNLENLSGDFRALAKELQTTPYELNMILGSLWWRADQFYRLAVDAAKLIEPARRQQKKSRHFSRSKTQDLPPATYQMFMMMTHMGLMGHFLGDASMPYHSSSNFDGWPNGRGGIHHYYEAQIVDAFGMDFMARFADRARNLKLPPLKSEKNYAIERLRSLTILAHDEMPQIEKIDIVIKPSTQKEAEEQIKARNSKNRKKPKNALRPDPSEMAKKFETLILDEMARSALATAELWDRIYTDAGSPSLEGYETYKFPFQPEFVFPDYAKD